MINEIIECERLIEITNDAILVGEVTFRKDFGRFKIGEQYESLEFNHSEGYLKAYEKNYNPEKIIEKIQKVKLVPDFEEVFNDNLSGPHLDMRI